MSATLEPREVERPFVRRWLRASGLLLFRAPLRFGVVMLALALLDQVVLQLASGSRVLWIDQLGTFILPMIWTLVSVIARGVDDARLARRAFEVFVRSNIWLSLFLAVLPVVGMELLVTTVLGRGGLFSSSPGLLRYPAQVINAVVSDIVLFIVWFGPCYFPLRALVPEASHDRARELSKRASQLNGEILIWVLNCFVVLCASALAIVVPVHGLAFSIAVVFVGVLNYVAYRDIFERVNLDAPAPAASTSRALQAIR